jgi:hypothetical protein
MQFKPVVFVVYIKCDNTRFRMLRVKNFPKLYKWLDANEPDWRFGNVWHGGKQDKAGTWKGGVQVGSFTKNNRVPKFYPA